MGDFEQYEKIELYLKNELSPEEKITFENDIKNNPKLAEAVEMHRLEWDAMEVLIEQDLKKKMTEWQPFNTSSIDTNPSVYAEKSNKLRLTQRNWLLGIAASLTLLVVAIFWFYNKPEPQNKEITKTDPSPKIDTPSVFPPKTNEKTEDNIAIEKPQNQDIKKVDTPTIKDDYNYLAFAEEAYQKSAPPQYSDMETRGENTENSLDEAGKAYDKKDYKRTIDLLKNTPATDENFVALEILGHAYFQSKNYKSALPIFQNLLKMSGKKSKEKSEWYLLLCYLSDYKNHKTAFKVLSDSILAHNDHAYFEVTKNLFNKINK